MKVITNIDDCKVAKLIKDNNVVALYQGRSEGGPRALGNRSLLFNPITEDMNLYVNALKEREFYRPVAGTILFDDVLEWFDMGNIKESPYMTFAVDVISEKINKIPAVVHKNNTCRIQTLKENQNFHFYNLIKEFKKITGVPIVGNTSFNLAGDTIVETLKDALFVIQDSLIDFLYLPEKKVLVYSKSNKNVSPRSKERDKEMFYDIPDYLGNNIWLEDF